MKTALDLYTQAENQSTDWSGRQERDRLNYFAKNYESYMKSCDVYENQGSHAVLESFNFSIKSLMIFSFEVGRNIETDPYKRLLRREIKEKISKL